MKKVLKASLIVAISCTSSFALSATESHQSLAYGEGETNIKVGPTESTRGPHGGVVGDPGIGSRAMRDGMTISFSGLTNMVPRKEGDVYIIETPAGVPSHRNMGKFQFSKVLEQEIYYGDWSATKESDDPMHTVYFSGKDATTAVPTSGSATYTIGGINQFNGEGKSNGTFVADFGDKTYTGALASEVNNYTMMGIIENSGEFSGTAIANDSVNGDSAGRFFGENAEHVAGVAVFEGDRSLDVAFGGSQDTSPE